MADATRPRTAVSTSEAIFLNHLRRELELLESGQFKPSSLTTLAR